MNHEELTYLSQTSTFLLMSNVHFRIYHLQTELYHHHKIFQKFYEGIEDVTDKLIETIQGHYGIKLEYDLEMYSMFHKMNSAEDYLLKLKQQLHCGCDLVEYSPIKTLLDEVLLLIDKTLYLISLN